MLNFVNHLVRALVTPLHRLRRRPDGTSGAHAIALTPERKLVLVRLRYAPGWRVPGGGRSSAETLEQAVLRELREEIGMCSNGSVRPSPIAGVLIVEDVVYRPRKWSWEVEQICEAPLDGLPAGLSPRTHVWLEAARETL